MDFLTPKKQVKRAFRIAFVVMGVAFVWTMAAPLVGASLDVSPLIDLAIVATSLIPISFGVLLLLRATRLDEARARHWEYSMTENRVLLEELLPLRNAAKEPKSIEEWHHLLTQVERLVSSLLDEYPEGDEFRALLQDSEDWSLEKGEAIVTAINKLARWRMLPIIDVVLSR